MGYIHSTQLEDPFLSQFYRTHRNQRDQVCIFSENALLGKLGVSFYNEHHSLQIFFIVNPYQFPLNAIKKTIPITFGTQINRAMQHMSKQFIIAFFLSLILMPFSGI